jgi:hypothetical protein
MTKLAEITEAAAMGGGGRTHGRRIALAAGDRRDRYGESELVAKMKEVFPT